MSLLNDKDTLIQYRYQIRLFILFSDDSIMSIEPERVTSIEIENMYETGKLPVFKLSILVEPSDFFKIIKDKNDVQFQVRVQKYGINLKTRKKTLVKDIINDTFGLLIDENPEDLELELRKRKNDNKHKIENVTNIMDIYLFKKEIVSGISQPSNIIVRNTTLPSLVTQLLYQAGCRKVLMSPFDNITEYDRILLPPQSIYDNIKWLDNYYGFYKTGSMIFFGLDKTYVLKYGPTCTAWLSNEYTDTTILISQNAKESESSAGMVERNGECQNYINGGTASIQIINNILGIKLSVGSDASFINSSINEIKNVKNEYDVGIDGKYNYINNHSVNPYLDTTYEQRIKSEEVVINMSLVEYDYSSLEPNKRINLVFEDQALSNKYNGVYKVAAIMHKFLRDGDDFTLASAVNLKKMK